jgi:hypothetical protein
LAAWRLDYFWPFKIIKSGPIRTLLPTGTLLSAGLLIAELHWAEDEFPLNCDSSHQLPIGDY